MKAAWVYFEVPFPGGLQVAVFENRVFLEIAARRINTIRFTDGAFKTTLWFTRDEPKRELNARPDEESLEQVPARDVEGAAQPLCRFANGR